MKPLAFILIAAVGMATCNAQDTLDRTAFVALNKEDCKKLKEFADRRDTDAMWDMYKLGTIIDLDKGTVVILDEVGFWDGVDRIHVKGKSQTLYIPNHYYRVVIGAWGSPAESAPVEANQAVPAASVTPVKATPSASVISAITSNRWTTDSLIVSGTLTNSSAVPVQITGIDAKGFDQAERMVTRGSDFTVAHNDLAPGEVVNFKVALKDDAKQVKFVKVLPSWSP
jgi:hypothetical protein